MFRHLYNYRANGVISCDLGAGDDTRHGVGTGGDCAEPSADLSGSRTSRLYQSRFLVSLIFKVPESTLYIGNALVIKSQS